MLERWVETSIFLIKVLQNMQLLIKQMLRYLDDFMGKAWMTDSFKYPYEYIFIIGYE